MKTKEAPFSLPVRPNVRERSARTAFVSTNAVPSVVQDVLSSPGQPLDGAAQAFMEPRFGHDFSGVRVHTDAKAADSARAVNAHAYTVGNHIAFEEGQYAPGSSSGRRLLAHELTHVVQQGRSNGQTAAPAVSADHSLERDADNVASVISRGQETVSVAEASAPGLLARQEKPEEHSSYRERLRQRLAGAYQSVKTYAPSSVQAYLLEPLKEPVKHLLQAAPESVLKKVEREAEPILQTVEALPAALPRSKKAASPVAVQNQAPSAAPPVVTSSSRPPQPQQAVPPAAADWTTQTEWVFSTTKHSPFSMTRRLDTGNSALNFTLNKVLLPWDNALNAVANTPFEMMGELDDFMMRSPVAMEWQAAQAMMPLGRAMGLAVEAPGGLNYLRLLLSSASRSARVEAAAVTLLGTAAKTAPAGEFFAVPPASGQLLLPGFEEIVGGAPPAATRGTAARGTAAAGWQLPSGLSSSTEHLIPVAEGASTMQPRQLQFFDMARPSDVSAMKWNKMLRDLYTFKPPQGGGTVKMSEQLLRFDAEGNLTQVMTNQEMLGTRVSYFATKYPGKAPGYNFGHLGGVSEFGTNDWLSQTHGGFPMEAAFNQTGAFAVAEGRSGIAVSNLTQNGRPFLKVAEAKGFVQGIPSEVRIYVESLGETVYDSGWMQAPKTP